MSNSFTSTRAKRRVFKKAQKIRKGNGPFAVSEIKAMVANFEKTGSLKLQSGSARKPVSQDTIEEIATAIIDTAQDNIVPLPALVRYL